MKVVTRYVAEDGAEFAHENEALRRDWVLARCREIEAILPPRPARMRTSDRVLVPEASLRAFRRALVQMCQLLLPREDSLHQPPDTMSPFGYCGRVVSDALPHCVNELWWRWSCIKDGWEYEQPFFALHTDEWERDCRREAQSLQQPDPNAT